MNLLTVWAPLAAFVLVAAATPRDLPPPSSLAGLEPAIRSQLLDARAAVDRLLAAPAARPEHPPDLELAAAFGALGELYLIYDLTADAEPCLENAAALAPADPRWPYLLGTLRQGRRDGVGAEAAFRAALDVAPTDLPSLVRLGDLLLDGSRPREAGDAFSRALETDARSAAALDGLGRVAFAEHDYRNAIDRFEAALALQPQASALHYRLALAHRALGDLDRARWHLERRGETSVTYADPVLDAARRRITGVGALIQVGQLAASAGAVEIAESRFRDALRLDPRSPDAHFALAALLEAQGRTEEAIAEYREALRFGLQNVAVGVHVGGMLRDAGRPDEAAELLARTVESAPDSAELQYELAAALEQAGRIPAALDAYSRAIVLEPDPKRQGLLLFHRAEIEAGNGDVARAEVSLLQAVEVAPDLAEAHYNLATLEARRGELAASLPHFERAAALWPDNSQAHLALGMALLLSDRVLDARRVVEQALGNERALEDERALERDPGQLALEHLLARLLAAASLDAARDADRALALSRKLVAIQPSADHLETLAMSLAAAGRFGEAANGQQRAIEAIEAAGSGDLALAQRRLELYRERRPVLDPWKR